MFWLFKSGKFYFMYLTKQYVIPESQIYMIIKVVQDIRFLGKSVIYHLYFSFFIRKFDNKFDSDRFRDQFYGSGCVVIKTIDILLFCPYSENGPMNFASNETLSRNSCLKNASYSIYCLLYMSKYASLLSNENSVMNVRSVLGSFLRK